MPPPSGARRRAPQPPPRRRKSSSGPPKFLLLALPLGMFAAGLIIPACAGPIGAGLPSLVSNNPPAGSSPLSGVLQLIVVTSREWGGIEGRLQRFQRPADGKPWEPVGLPLAAVVGRGGMGWGRGLHHGRHDGAPVAHEGDQRSPAGVFELGPAFGYESVQKVSDLRIPYVQELGTTECVDDVNSRFYNMIVERAAIPDPDWKSSEAMSRAGEDYRWGIVIRQNDPPIPGGGSCIFLHAWGGPHRGTAGCTGIEQEKIPEVMHWLDGERHPTLVQLPRFEYERVRAAWDLPDLDGAGRSTARAE